MCDFSIVGKIVNDANVLYCRRWLSENGLYYLLKAYTPDDKIIMRWAVYMSKSTCKDIRKRRAQRIVLMMCALRAQHYCVFSYQWIIRHIFDDRTQMEAIEQRMVEQWFYGAQTRVINPAALRSNLPSPSKCSGHGLRTRSCHARARVRRLDVFDGISFSCKWK